MADHSLFQLPVVGDGQGLHKLVVRRVAGSVYFIQATQGEFLGLSGRRSKEKPWRPLVTQGVVVVVVLFCMRVCVSVCLCVDRCILPHLSPQQQAESNYV
jgi:hypothetical protein